jgi:hypothetical protein
MQELTQEEIDIVGGGSLSEVALYTGLGIIGVGLAVAAAPVAGAVLAGGAIATSGAGLAVFGTFGVVRENR